MRWVLLSVGYALAFSIPFLLENAAELTGFLPDSLTHPLEAAGSAYQRWAAGPRPSEARYTAVVTLNERDFPLLDDACRQRIAVANLIPRIVQAGAGELVLDLAFTRTMCPESEDKRATPLLRSALLDAAAQIPLVVGEAERTLGELEPTVADSLRRQGMKQDELLLRPTIDLPLRDPAYQISVGLFRLNEDFRRVPLSWSSFGEQDGKLSGPEVNPTLAFQAALGYRQPFPDGEKVLTTLYEEGRHPLTNLLPEDKFIHLEAAELECRGESTGQSAPCNAAISRDARRKLNGKVVLLGWEDNPKDLWTTAAGQLPGVFLQANFVESLLDSRYLRVLSARWQIGLSVVWFAAIEACFLINEDAIWKALVLAIIVFIVGAFLFYYIAVVNLGFYLALLPPSFVAVLLRCWYQVAGRKKTKEGKDGEHEANQDRGARTGADNAGSPVIRTGQIGG